tara:strand:- start:616 stop:2103 length:1488 start_codon:yes stop_codon:yes gene_type:complete
MKDKVLVIMGQHRSGTSVLSGCLKILGSYLGTDYQEEKDQYNEKGYFEGKWTDHVNNTILNKLGMEWNHATDLPNTWYNHPKLEELYGIVRTHILRDLENKPEGSFYTIKDPRISLILPFYIRVFKQLGLEPKFIFSDRENSEMIESLVKRDNLNPELLEPLLNYHRFYCKKYIGEEDIIWTHTFKNILYKPLNFLSYIIKKFELPNNINDETKKEILEFIDVKLKHHSTKTNAKIICTYFGHRRTNIVYGHSDTHSGEIPKHSGVSNTIGFIKELLKNERTVDSGVFMDTILINHDVSDITKDKEAKKFLESIDGTPTRNGVIKVINRPFDNGIGGGFGSFNHAYQKHKEDYEYWFFTEDNVIQTKDNYFKQSIKQLEENERVGYICGYRHTTLKNNEHEKSHCHGGCGTTHISHLNKVNKNRGELSYYKEPFNDEMIENINDVEAFGSHAWAWYSGFEDQGEVGFTYSFIESGLLLQDIQMDDKFCCYYGDCY